MLIAFEIGASLALAGLALQSLLKNPLVEPYLVGASSGAAFGATVVLVLIPSITGTIVGEFGYSMGLDTRIILSIAAFLGALAAIAFLYIASYRQGDFSTKRLILMGVVMGAFLSSIVALMMIVSGENLKRVIWWLMGSLTIAPRGGWIFLGIVLIASWVFLFLRSYKLNLLSQGEEIALGLGVKVRSLKLEILIVSSVLTAAAVSISGVIGFVGLIVPHFFRMIHGPDNRILVPVTGIGGGILLMAADLLAHNIVLGELPVGIITTILGAPFFWFVLSTPAGEK
jgi:iron complex transport system permease protein